MKKRNLLSLVFLLCILTMNVFAQSSLSYDADKTIDKEKDSFSLIKRISYKDSKQAGLLESKKSNLQKADALSTKSTKASTQPILYQTSLLTQESSSVFVGYTEQKIVGIQVVVDGDVGTLPITKFALKTTGSTDVSDFVNAKLFYTGTSSVFSTSNPYGITVALPDGAFTFEESLNLSSGTNYFWLTYDVAATATEGNVMDAICDSIIVDGNIKIPTVTDPTGEITIAGIPSLTVSPDTLFATVTACNDSITKQFTIENTGDGELIIQNSTREPNDTDYIVLDSDQPNGPVFNWYDISTIGTSTGLSGDDNYVEVSLPFDFTFYGEIKNSMRVSTNGYLTFGTSATYYSNTNIPNSNEPNDMIAPLWDDLNGAGQNYYYNDASKGRFIIQYSNWPNLNNSGTYDFQVHLYKDGTIIFYYQNLNGDLIYATVGIENYDASEGHQVAYNESYLHNDLAISFLQESQWLNLSVSDDIINSGESKQFDVEFNALETNAGIDTANIIISSNDPDNGADTIVCIFTVEGSPVIVASSDTYNFGDLYVNATSIDTLVITNTGCDTLKVTDIVSNESSFTVNTSVFNILPNNSQEVLVTFAPTSAADYTGTLTIQNNDVETVINVSGSGISAPALSVSHDTLFATVTACNDSITKQFTIENTGADDLIFEVNTGFNELEAGNIINTHSNFTTNCTGIVRVNDFIYSLNYESNLLQKYDISTQQIVESWSIHTQPFGITYDGEYLWIGNPSGTIRNYDLSGNVLGSSFTTPFSNYSAVTWNGQYFVVSNAYTNNSDIYMLDNSGSIIETFTGYLGSSYEFAWNTVDGTIWVNDYVNGKINQLKVANGTVELNNFFMFSDDSESYAIAHDGTDIWYSDWNGPLYELNDGIIRWLDLSTNTGTIATGDSLQVDVEFNATDLNSGLYSAYVIINSNDPVNTDDTVVCIFTVEGSPAISASADSYDFGDVFVNATSIDTLVITNTGCDTLKVTDIVSNESTFTVDTSVFNILPNHTQNVLITFAPTSVADFTGTLTIQNNDIETLINILGSGISAPVLSVSSDTLFATVTACNDSVTKQFTIKNTGGNDLDFVISNKLTTYLDSINYTSYGETTNHIFTDLDISDSIYITVTLNGDYDGGTEYATLIIDGTIVEQIDDGNVVNGTDIIKSYAFGGTDVTNWLIDGQITVSIENSSEVNPGNGGLELNAVELSIRSIKWINISEKSGTIITGDSLQIEVEFNALDINAGSDTTSLFISSNDPINTSDTLVCVFTVEGSPAISASADSYDFGDIAVTNTKIETVTITNAGCDTLKVSDIISNESVFSVNSSVFDILPNFSQELIITFAPLSITDYTGTLTINSNIDDYIINLNGSGAPDPILSVSTDTLRATITQCDSSTTKQFTINNTGGGELKFTNNEEASWLTLSEYNGTITSGESQLIDVEFNGEYYASGEYTSEIIVSANDPANDADTVVCIFTIDGSPEIILSDTALNYNNIYVDNTITQQITISNTGCENLTVTDITSSLPEYTISQTSFTVYTGSSVDLWVTFAPTTAGTFNGLLTIQNSNTNDTTISLYGTGITIGSPIVGTSVNSIDFGKVNEGILSVQEYSVDGYNLTNDININAPVGFEISSSTTADYASSITLNQTDGVVYATPIFVKFSPDAEQVYTGDITHTSTDALQADVEIQAENIIPIVTSTSSLDFAYVVPNDTLEMSFILSGKNLSDYIYLYAPDNFTLSLTSGSGFSSSLGISPNSTKAASYTGIINDTTIYVRFVPTSKQEYMDTITLSSYNCSTVSVAVSGTGLCYDLSVSTIQDQAICPDEDVLFTTNVTTEGTEQLTYIWKKGDDVLSNGGNISGATTNSLTIATVSATDAGNYSCTVNNSCGNDAVTNAASLTVYNNAVITEQPIDASLNVGDDAIFSVTATDVIGYQWQKGGVNIFGATSDTYTINSVETTDAGSYNVVVSGLCNDLPSDVVSLSIATSVNDLNQYGINVYPNPSNGIFNISYDKNIEAVEVTITSVDGKVIYHENQLSDNNVVDVSNESKGIYILKFVNDGNTYISRLVIE